jgi:Holliday junction resolvase RusA-like endonuclease
MAVYLEFVVPGPPISNQQSSQSGRANLAAWRVTLRRTIRPLWRNPPLQGSIKAIIINFCSNNGPTVDVDNMSKPIFDLMQKIVYWNDRQIAQAELTHVKIGAAFAIMGAPIILVNSIHAGAEFVYVRIEDPVDPFPLPKA